MALSPYRPLLQDVCAAEFDRIRAQFEADGDGVSAARMRASAVDRIIQQLYQECISLLGGETDDLCIIALGGYGRRELFPFSDIDLLFVSSKSSTLAALRESIGRIVRTLWDLRLRASQTCRTLDDCSVLHRDNLEFNVALVDLRHVAGSDRLFDELRNSRIPRLMGRDGKTLLADLIEMTRQRHQKHWNTIFHLEPNIKEAPGGFRDLHVIRWLGIISELESSGRWKAATDMFPQRS